MSAERMLRCEHQGSQLLVGLEHVRSVRRHGGRQTLILNDEGYDSAIPVEILGSVVEAPRRELLPLPSALAPYREILRGMMRIGDESLPLVTPAFFREGHSFSLVFDRSVRHEVPPGPVPASAKPRKALVFHLDNAECRRQKICFAISSSQLLEVTHNGRISPLPGAPAHVRGMVPGRSACVPVIDLGLALGFGASGAGEDLRIVTVRDATGSLAALPVEATTRNLDEQCRIFADDRELPVDSRLVRAHFRLDGESLVFPRLEAIVPAPGPR